MHVQPYLIFPGTCREALDFYAQAFGGKIEHIQTVGESPLPAAPEHADRIFNSVLSAGDLTLRASDSEAGKDQRVGENVALFVVFDSPEDQERVFATMAEDGNVLFPLDHGFGMLEDRFQIRWMMALETNS